MSSDTGLFPLLLDLQADFMNISVSLWEQIGSRVEEHGGHCTSHISSSHEVRPLV